MTSGGALNTRQTYYPYGAKRVADGSPLPTQMDYTFTGQKSDDSTGLMFYNARYYDTTLGRFTQADTIVPGAFNPQTLNRYAYALNNPVRYTDPTGHMVKDEDDAGGGTDDPEHPVGQTTVTPENANDYYQPSAETAGTQYPNGKECWPKCNEIAESRSCNSELANPCQRQSIRMYAEELYAHKVKNRSSLQIGPFACGAGMGYGGCVSGGPVCATFGGCDIQVTVSGGASTGWGGFTGMMAARTDAYTTDQLKGLSGMVGFTTPPIKGHSLGIEWTKTKSSWEGQQVDITGNVAYVGPGSKLAFPTMASPNRLSIPFEVHGSAGYTIGVSDVFNKARDLLGLK